MRGWCYRCHSYATLRTLQVTETIAELVCRDCFRAGVRDRKAGRTWESDAEEESSSDRVDGLVLVGEEVTYVDAG